MNAHAQKLDLFDDFHKTQGWSVFFSGKKIQFLRQSQSVATISLTKEVEWACC